MRVTISESESLVKSNFWTLCFTSVLHYAWNVGFVLFNRPNPRLWEIVQQKAPILSW